MTQRRNLLSQPTLETIAGVIEAMSVNPDTRRIALRIREDDGRFTEAIAIGDRAIAHSDVFRCGQRITLRGIERWLAGGGLEFVICEVWTAL
jgi:hypothetical protein